MRDISNIIFRGKRKSGEWVYGLLGCCYVRPNEKYYFIHNCETDNTEYTVIPETIGQYTGLTANGKKIFEGDIVKFNNQIGTIINEYGSWGIGIDECINYKRLELFVEDEINNFYSGVYNDNFISLWEICWNCNTIDERIKEIEVIGNIHDNPELLEVQNER